MSVQRVSRKAIRKAISPGKKMDVAPTGISPILRSSWKFARKMAERFNQELLKDRTENFLKNLAKRFD